MGKPDPSIVGSARVVFERGERILEKPDLEKLEKLEKDKRDEKEKDEKQKTERHEKVA